MDSETWLDQIRRSKLKMGMVVAGAVLILLELVAWPLAPKRMDAAADQARSTETAMRGSDLLGWELVPGQSRAFGVTRPTMINQLGTRNPELGAKHPGTLRMITLGDSSVYGVMVEDAEVFSAVAARDLQHALGQQVEAINGGVPGYSSEQARRLFTYRLAKLQPDIVVIATLWSDSQPGPAPDAMRFGSEGNHVQTMLRWSNTYRLLEGLLLGWRPAPQVGWTLTEGEDGRRVPIQAYRNNLDTLAQLAKAAGAVPVFLILPCDRDLGPTDLEAPRPAYRVAMRAAADRQGGVLVETPAHFAGKSADHFFDDVHPTAKGHAIVGRLLAKGIGSRIKRTTR
jgi:lysophospholipase L1-like esterase